MPAIGTPEFLSAMLNSASSGEGHLHVCLTCPGSEAILTGLHNLAQDPNNPYAEDARHMLETFASSFGIPLT